MLIAQRRILAALRDAVFFSLSELNAAIRNIVDEINAEPFQKREGNRNELFEQYERAAAKPLPKQRYAYGKWKNLSVHPDHHVQVDKGYYSVHYTLIGQDVWARLGARIVQIYQHGKVIAAHVRVERPWQRRTLPEHRPAEHRAFLDLGFDKLLDRAQKIGPHTAAVLAKQAFNKKHLDETIRGSLGILRLADDFTPETLERACAMALQYGVYNYRSVRDLIVNGRKASHPPEAPATAGLVHANVRGATYYTE